jgi:hypothetical protein
MNSITNFIIKHFFLNWFFIASYPLRILEEKKMSKIVKSSTSRTGFTTGGKEVSVRVVDDQGRVGRGTSGGIFTKGNEVDATARAIRDAKSKN